MDQYTYRQQPNPFHDLKRFFRNSGILPRLIMINTGVWLLVQIVFLAGWAFNMQHAELESWILHYFSLPADPGQLLVRPWSLITYMFLHTSFWHILFNMLWLYWFGKIFTQYLSQRQMLVTYIAGGLAGGLLYILAYNTLPVFREIIPLARALGASASVMAIVTAIAFYVPNYTIQLLLFGRVKIFYLAVVLFVIDFFMIRHGNAGGHIAHIGGAVYGFIYIYYLRRGKDFSRMFPRFSGSSGSFARKKTTYRRTKVKKPVTDEEYNRQRAEKQKKIDHILDKISRSGYDSLTREEKELLFNNSNKNQ
jgi:membrane associated rhomboid family serine protease